jgi:hypothetical protein
MSNGAPPRLPADGPGLRFWLLRGMARAADITLAEARAEGRKGLAACRELLAACSACRAEAACLDWLSSPAPPPVPPPFCAIGAALAGLGSGGGTDDGDPGNRV